MMRVNKKRDMTTIQLIGVVSLFIAFFLSILKFFVYFYVTISELSDFFVKNINVFFLAVGLLMFYWNKRNSSVILLIAVIASVPVMFLEHSNLYFIIESIVFIVLIIHTIIIIRSNIKYLIIIAYLFLILVNIVAINTDMGAPSFFLIYYLPKYGVRIHYLIQPIVIIFFITNILTINKNKSNAVQTTHDEQINLNVNNCRNCGASINNNERICYNCGFDPLDGSYYCQNCGSKTAERQIVCLNCRAKLVSITNTNKNYLSNNELDQNNKDLNIISFLLPIIGLVLYIIYHQNYPVKSKGIVKWSFTGLILGVFLSSLYYFLIISSFY